MPAIDPAVDPVLLCASDALVERGDAVVFDVQQWRRKVGAFVMRFEGRVVAYLNQCAHVPTEMDWQEGKFLDRDREAIICSIHGATYDPLSGRCVGGPCVGGRLTALRVEERDAQVYWYPSSDIKPWPVALPRDDGTDESPP
ncbi:MAG: Rieske 2Fe-2S domain-containing protein [Burkholderiaceae bacterium]|nr:Rieske 2Fe-2S domain-containing protein [Burkholderiaceae bacterium]